MQLKCTSWRLNTHPPAHAPPPTQRLPQAGSPSYNGGRSGGSPIPVDPYNSAVQGTSNTHVIYVLQGFNSNSQATMKIVALVGGSGC